MMYAYLHSGTICWAIQSFQMPDKPTVTDIRSWYGFVNELAPFLATVSIMNSFRELLKKSTGKHVYWDEQLREKFHQTQDTICQLAQRELRVAVQEG